LTAWASEGKVDLRFLPADFSLKDPNNYGVYPYHPFDIYRMKVGEPGGLSFLAKIQNNHPPAPDYYDKDWDIFYTDTTVDSEEVYIYKVESALDESGNWDDVYDDKSNAEAVATLKGTGNALVLDGINHYVEADLVSNDLRARGYLSPVMVDTAEAITFEAWVYPESQSGKGSVLSFNTSSGGNYNLLLYDGTEKKFCYYDTVNGWIHSPTQSLPGHWYHVAVTIKRDAFPLPDQYDGVLYVNGVQQKIFEPSITPSRTALFSIGQEWDGSLATNHFKGMVDEVRIWNKELTRDDIQAGMRIPMRGDEEGLIGLWHFDEPPNSRNAMDATPHGNDGTLSGYNTSDIEFVPSWAMILGDIDNDGDVDGSDLSEFTAGIVSNDYDVGLLSGFADEYGRISN